jgi:ABC-type oligopeptide transport system ATPase subunit
MTTLLEVRGVSRDFSVGRGLFASERLLRAVIDINVRVEKGDVLGIVGESGSGKSACWR